MPLATFTAVKSNASHGDMDLFPNSSPLRTPGRAGLFACAKSLDVSLEVMRYSPKSHIGA